VILGSSGSLRLPSRTELYTNIRDTTNGNDRESHKRVLSYMLENGLIRKTKTGKLYNISFKFDSETYAGKYKGSGFSGKIKLADFVDLESGEFI